MHVVHAVWMRRCCLVHLWPTIREAQLSIHDSGNHDRGYGYDMADSSLNAVTRKHMNLLMDAFDENVDAGGNYKLTKYELECAIAAGIKTGIALVATGEYVLQGI